MSVVLIYVTTGSEEEAANIGRGLVDEGLIACANILPRITSIYRWEGAVRADSEVSLILKTRASLVDRVVERIRILHSYDCPCVVAFPVVGGNAPFLDWIESETTSAAS